MITKNRVAAFEDAPPPERLEAAIRHWKWPELTDTLKTMLLSSENMVSLLQSVKRTLANHQNAGRRSRYEQLVIDRLFDFIRLNVKRGRVFDLRQVFRQHVADCLGYCKLFTLLGRLTGLDVGVIEVVIDNRGRLVPHTAVLVKLSNGRLRFIDLWYGVKNIRHKKLGLYVKRGDQWAVEDLEMKELVNHKVSYLPDRYVDGITHYVLGNRTLNRKDYNGAIQHYSKALELYPENARVHYNRAVSYENLGETEKALADYKQAVRDEASVTRISATEHEDITALIELDAKGLDERAQKIYLLANGFVTGRKISPTAIARRLAVSEKEVREVLEAVETTAEKNN